MKIYTRTGDDGTTALFGADRVSKHHVRIEAYGTVDEVNAVLGLVRATCSGQVELNRLDTVLNRIQHELFILGADLATPGDTTYAVPRIQADHTLAVEQDIDAFEADVEPLKHFILPGGTRAAASLHMARTVCRRAERRVVLAAETEDVNPEIVSYLNRISDLLFVLARWANKQVGMDEPRWIPVVR